jgi:hypothetical protein
MNSAQGMKPGVQPNPNHPENADSAKATIPNDK